MKNKQKWLWIISIIVIGFAAASCADDNVTTATHNHTWGEWSVTTAATCVAKGAETRACSGCTETQTQDIAINPNNHDPQPVDGEIEVAPTCTVGGFGKVACARTGCTHTENGAPIDPLDHEGTIAPFAATCITAGNSQMSGECVRFAQCNHVVTGTVVGANGHTWGWEETTPATCLVAATDTHKCDVCGTFDTAVTQPGHHALGHSSGIDAIEVSCEVDGYSGGSGPCIHDGCDEVLPAGIVTPKWGHDYHDWTAPTCTTDGNHERFCVNDCGTIDTRTTGYAALGHSGNWAITTPPNFTAETDGEETRTCSTCSTPETRVYKFYKIGDTGPAGGIIFYVAPSGITIQGYGNSGDNGYFATYTAYYLEAAPANETNSMWQAASENTLIAGVTTFTSTSLNNTSIGVGRKDTQTIVNSAAFAALTDTAAQRCANKSLNGFTDWFLPSLVELNEIYKAGVAGVTGIPTTGRIWSSSQANNVSAWHQDFDNGNRTGGSKANNINVRAIRAF